MPEGPEVETEKLHEAIHEEMERDGGSFLRRIALTTALLAVLASVAALRAGATVNHALLLRTDATQLQSQASDQWAYYQAKGVKGAVQDAVRASWLAAGKEPPTSTEDKIARYEKEQEAIKEKALEFEKERDVKVHESEHLLHGHHRCPRSRALPGRHRAGRRGGADPEPRGLGGVDGHRNGRHRAARLGVRAVGAAECR